MNEVYAPYRSLVRRNKIKAIVAATAINLSAASCSLAIDTPTATVESSTQMPGSQIDFEGETVHITTEQALRSLGSLAVSGRAPKTGYSRDKFGSGWTEASGCDTRNLILKRDLTEITFNSVKCEVLSGVLLDPYSGATIDFVRGADTSDDVQIDHVVSLSNAWQMGAQQFTYEKRVDFANDPFNLRAVDGKLNQAKSDGDFATWKPPKKDFWCELAAQQIGIKDKYNLRVTQAEHDAFVDVLRTCPGDEFAIPN